MPSHYSIYRRSKSTANRFSLLVLKHFFLLAILILFTILTSPVQASDKLYAKAKLALEQKHYEIAESLFKQLENQSQFKSNALLGLAKVSFFSGQLDEAEDYVEELLELFPTDPEHWFIAGRIAGKQAQSASIFTKLGYAKDTKALFSKALEIDEDHKPAIIGLLRFHQQAPVMAGGDKASIPALVNRLRNLDRREAFNIEAPMLMDKKEIDKTIKLYKKAINSKSEIEIGAFRFNFAMLLSNHGLYQEALEELIQLDLNSYAQKPDFYHMSYYQIAKTAAESESRLEQGLKSIKQYSAFLKDEQTIPSDWTQFRTDQLTYLLKRSSDNRTRLESLRVDTSDDDLKDKIKSFLKENAIKVKMEKEKEQEKKEKKEEKKS